MTPSAIYILSLLSLAMPAERGVRDSRGYGKDAWETEVDPSSSPEAFKNAVDARLVRYQTIAEAFDRVVFDPAEPPIFAGANGRYKTAAMAVALWKYESSLNANVQFGRGKYSKGDSGHSYCLAQINMSYASRVVLEGRGVRFSSDPTEGWTGDDLVQDLDKCLRVGLHMIRTSVDRCSHEGKKGSDLFNVYASGSCDAGSQASKVRWDEGVWIFGQAKIPTEALPKT